MSEVGFQGPGLHHHPWIHVQEVKLDTCPHLRNEFNLYLLIKDEPVTRRKRYVTSAALPWGKRINRLVTHIFEMEMQDAWKELSGLW